MSDASFSMSPLHNFFSQSDIENSSAAGTPSSVSSRVSVSALAELIGQQLPLSRPSSMNRESRSSLRSDTRENSVNLSTPSASPLHRSFLEELKSRKNSQN